MSWSCPRHSVSQFEKMKAICEVNTAQQNSHASLLPTLLDASLFSGQTIDIRSDWRHEVDAESDRGAQRSRHCSRSRLARSGCSCCCRCSCQLLLLLLNAWLFRTKPHSATHWQGSRVFMLKCSLSKQRPPLESFSQHARLQQQQTST